MKSACTAKYGNGARSRTPQGVRGLKWSAVCIGRREHEVAPRKGCVD